LIDLPSIENIWKESLLLPFHSFFLSIFPTFGIVVAIHSEWSMQTEGKLSKFQQKIEKIRWGNMDSPVYLAELTQEV